MHRIPNRNTLASLITIALVVLGACILLDRPLVRGDGLAYFIWLDSLARDVDLNLANQAVKFAHLNTYHVFPRENRTLCIRIPLWQCFTVGTFLLAEHVGR